MRRQALIMTIAILALGGAAHSQDAATGYADFTDAKGEANGKAELTGMSAGGVLIKQEVTGLPANEWVAFHVHEAGSCDHATKHGSAGGHFNPSDKEHGFNAPNGPHAGDMPNQYVSSDGVLRAEIANPTVSLGDGKTGIKGRALVVHARGDDYASQPSGDAGDRLACAVIE